MRNELDRLWTLTYAEPPADVEQVWADIEDFRRRISKLLGRRIPLAATIERGEKNGRLHVHLAAGQFVAKSLVEDAWRRRGWVDLRKLKVDGAGRRERCRRVAGYLSAYLGKGELEDRKMNGRRYSVTKGFQPVRRSRRVGSFGGGVELAREWNGGWIIETWSSSSLEDWKGPPCMVLRFSDGDPLERFAVGGAA